MYNSVLTSKIKNIISMKGLIDSGKLLNETFIDITITNKLIINIVTTDYFKFLYVKNNIINEFISSIEFITMLEQEYSKILEINIQNILDDKSNIEFDYVPVLLLNGY